MTSEPVGETPPLFDLAPAEEHGDEAVVRVRSVRQAKCPECMAPKTGLAAVGAHLVWREHYLTTWSGARVVCRTSGVAVCVAPERNPLKPDDPARCPHDK